MPTGLEVGKSLSVSTIDNWSTISDWYKDLATSKTSGIGKKAFCVYILW